MDPKLLIDGHVHLRPGLPVQQLLDAAATNFAVASGGLPWRGMLWLLEAKGSRYFESLWEVAGAEPASQGLWRLARAAGEDVSLRAEHVQTGMRIDLVSGCQVATAERLEVCVVATRQVPPDALDLDDTVARCLELEGLVFLPWGAGKWTGTRGLAVERLLRSERHAGRLYAADNGGRPAFWRRPEPFSMLEATGGRVVAGSDPLPIAGDERRAGSFGFSFAGAIEDHRPGRDLVRRLREGAPIEYFGSPLSSVSFLASQLALRLRPVTS